MKIKEISLVREFLFTKNNTLNDCFSSQSKNRESYYTALKYFRIFTTIHIIIIFYFIKTSLRDLL